MSTNRNRDGAIRSSHEELAVSFSDPNEATVRRSRAIKLAGATAAAGAFAALWPA